MGGFKNNSDLLNYDDRAIVTKSSRYRYCEVCLAIPEFRYFSFHPYRLHHCIFERRSTILLKRANSESRTQDFLEGKITTTLYIESLLASTNTKEDRQDEIEAQEQEF